MAWYDPRHILGLFKRTQIPIVVDGDINPDLLVVARRGYWIQSRVLRIPDRYGFFTSDPPLLQAHQAHKLTMIATEAVAPVISASIAELMVFDTRWWFPVSMAAISLSYIISIYVGEIFFNPMRAPDYNWNALSKKMGVVQSAA